MSRHALYVVGLIVLGAVCLTVEPESGRAAAAASPNFTMSATSRCLARKGAKITPVPRTNPRLRALHDLAQRNSIQVRIAGRAVGVAFSKSESAARLLAELLQVPRDPYHVVLRRNALLMFRTVDRTAFTAAAACLRS
jgi:hypothetical protein